MKGRGCFYPKSSELGLFSRAVVRGPSVMRHSTVPRGLTQVPERGSASCSNPPEELALAGDAILREVIGFLGEHVTCKAEPSGPTPEVVWLSGGHRSCNFVARAVSLAGDGA